MRRAPMVLYFACSAVAAVALSNAFIDYFLRPEISASLTNELGYATANKASLANVKPELAQDQAVFPNAENLQKMVSPASFSNEARESMSNAFSSFKKGK